MASVVNDKNVKANFPKRLMLGTKTWQKISETPLANRMTMLRALESGFYSNKGKGSINKSHPINLIDRGLSILVPYLVLDNPRLLITSKKTELRPFAETTQLAFNHLIKEIKFARNSLRPVVRDAMFGLGIMKTGLMKSHELEVYGHLHEVGQVYSDPVDMVDYIGDPTATCFEGMEFEGNFYRLPVDVAKDMYPKHADILNATYQLHSDEQKNNPKKISKAKMVEGEFCTLKQYVQLADFWIPDEGVILTIEPKSATILRTVEAETPGWTLR